MKISTPAKALLAMVTAGLGFGSVSLAVTPPPGGGYPFQNTALGEDALLNLLLDADEGGYQNTALGWRALYTTRSGAANTAVGSGALLSNTTGSSNNAIGDGALTSNTTGGGNVANGVLALDKNTTGNGNVADGANALQNNITGSDNTAMGNAALASNETASNNTASGATALFSNTSGANNTASGMNALGLNNSGSFNVADGQGALSANTTGSNNTAVGQNALPKVTTGKSNIALGSNAGSGVTTGSSNIEIGNRGVTNDNKTIRVGTQGTQTATFVAGISGATVAAGVSVVVDPSGHLGTVVSSERFKDDIRPMKDSSEALLKLKPVTFHYKKGLDPKGIPQFGLVAEEVEKVDPDLVARDETGKPYTVRYEAVNAMLLNEFLKEHDEVEQLKATVAQLSAALKAQAKNPGARRLP